MQTSHPHPVVPTRAIFSEADLARFHESQTNTELLSFVRMCNDNVAGKAISETTIEGSPVLQQLVEMLHELYDMVDDIPPVQQPMRFGNTAFRTWHARLTEKSESYIRTIVGPDLEAFVIELAPYLCGSFGHPTRIDYGTGHETSFVVFLYCLYKLRVISAEAIPALVLRVFAAYIRTMRRLQEVYMLEPAGSHGVWGLDDYYCLVFLWGSSQLRLHPSITPQSIHNDSVLAEYSDEYLYLQAIRFIKQIKSSVPFGESSPMLNDISALPDWKKVNTGLLRLYQGEVLGKLPVIQHFLFGSLFPATWQPSAGPGADGPAVADVYTRMPAPTAMPTRQAAHHIPMSGLPTSHI